MVHLLLLLEAHVWYVLLIVGIATVFITLIRVVDLHKFKCEPRAHVNRLSLGMGIIFLSLGVVFYFFGGPLDNYPNLDGRWTYEVRNSQGQFSHKGDSFVTGDGIKLSIHGTRRYTCGDRASNDGKCRLRRVSAPWNATWAQFCSDGRIRFNYTIDLPEGKLEGYCILAYEEKDNPSELAGYYYLLAPFDERLLNARFGQIVFRKMKPGEKLTPPSSEDVIITEASVLTRRAR